MVVCVYDTDTVKISDCFPCRGVPQPDTIRGTSENGFLLQNGCNSVLKQPHTMFPIDCQPALGHGNCDAIVCLTGILLPHKGFLNLVR